MALEMDSVQLALAKERATGARSWRARMAHQLGLVTVKCGGKVCREQRIPLYNALLVFGIIFNG